MPEEFSTISDIINKEPGLEKVRKLLKQSDVLRKFPEVFPDLVKIASAVKIEKNVLFLRVENSTWRSELRLREFQIVEKVNDYFKEIRINSIKFIP